MTQFLLSVCHAGSGPDISADEMNWARRATVACRLPVEVRTFAAEPPEVPGQ